MTNSVSVKLTETEQKALDQIVILKGYKSRSEAIREALRGLFDAAKVKDSTRQQMRLERLAAYPRDHRKRWEEEREGGKEENDQADANQGTTSGGNNGK